MPDMKQQQTFGVCTDCGRAFYGCIPDLCDKCARTRVTLSASVDALLDRIEEAEFRDPLAYASDLDFNSIAGTGGGL